MSERKPMSAAEYRANAEKVKSQRPTEIVELKSGSIFELRRPDLSAYMVTGRLPQSLMREGMQAWNAKKSPDQIAKELDDKSVIDSLIFMREIVHDCTVKPKFVEFATGDDEIGAADMLPEDFTEIFSWAMGHQGVAGLAGLQSFRPGSERGASGNRSHGKKRRRQAKSVIETVGAVQ
jgi:hypothetical protein